MIARGRTAIASMALAVLMLSGCAAPVASTTAPSATAESSGWRTYADPDNDSSVAAYEYGADYIQVQFTDGSVYVYTYASAGGDHIERMKELADSGDGLNAYIMANVKYDYESKSR